MLMLRGESVRARALGFELLELKKKNRHCSSDGRDCREVLV